MKTEVWVYTLWYLDKVWQGVFDCEVNVQQVANAFYDEVKSAELITRFSGSKRTLFRQKPDALAVIPEVQPEVMFSLERDLANEKWFKDELLKLTLDQPVLDEYLRKVHEQHNQLAALIGIVVYKLIESQIEADRI